MTWKIKSIAASIILSLIALFGWERYHQGVDDCKALQAQEIAQKGQASKVKREAHENETRRLNNSDVDRQLIDNGWMRPDGEV